MTNCGLFVSLLVALIAAGPRVHLAGAQQRTSRQSEFLRLIARPRVELVPEVKSLPPSGRFIREHFTFVAEAGGRVPGLAVKLVKAAGRRPAVIVLHGTGDSKAGMVPLLEA